MGHSPKISRVSEELLERMKHDPVEFTRLLAEDEARRHTKLQECDDDPLPYHDLRIELIEGGIGRFGEKGYSAFEAWRALRGNEKLTPEDFDAHLKAKEVLNNRYGDLRGDLPDTVQEAFQDGYDTVTGFVSHSKDGGAPKDSWKGNRVPWYRGRSRW